MLKVLLNDCVVCIFRLSCIQLGNWPGNICAWDGFCLWESIWKGNACHFSSYLINRIYTLKLIMCIPCSSENTIQTVSKKAWRCYSCVCIHRKSSERAWMEVSHHHICVSHCSMSSPYLFYMYVYMFTSISGQSTTLMICARTSGGGQARILGDTSQDLEYKTMD